MISDDIYKILDTQDMSIAELAITLNLSKEHIIRGIESATFRFHDLYSYRAKRGRKTVEVYGLIHNYNESKGII